jgi:hypothetical protein
MMLWILVEWIGVFPFLADSPRTFPWRGIGLGLDPFNRGYTAWVLGISIETATELGMGAMVERMRTSVFPPSADTRKTFRLWETGPAAEPQKSEFTEGEPGISIETATEYDECTLFSVSQLWWNLPRYSGDWDGTGAFGIGIYRQGHGILIE